MVIQCMYLYGVNPRDAGRRFLEAYVTHLADDTISVLNRKTTI